MAKPRGRTKRRHMREKATADHLTRELYHSSNGDRWYLVRDPDFERVFIRHQANLPSGGHTADIEIGAFLNRGGNPEHRELLRLIGTLVEGAADA
jgi:hypothetical protein